MYRRARVGGELVHIDWIAKSTGGGIVTLIEIRGWRARATIRIEWVPKRARIVHFKTRGKALFFDGDRFVEDV